MKIHRIYAIVLRFAFLFRHSLDKLFDTFYWPTIDLLIWGLTSQFFRKSNLFSSKILLILISGVLLWLIVWRGQYEISVNLLEEFWDKNLINIFVAPLKFSEWVVSLVIIGIIKAAISFSFALAAAFILYKVKIFFYGFYLIPFIILLIMTGWWVGFIVAGLILRYGTKIQTLAWAGIYVLSPFSAIYYPVSVLPAWAQKLAALVPTSYVFEGAREVINKGYLDPNKIYISLILSLIYLSLSIFFLKKSFDRALNKGLVDLY